MSGMDDLVQFLRDRYDEDEQTARAVGAQRIETGEYLWNSKYLLLQDGPNGESRATAELDGDLAEHIARHDPARVLREVEAKRLTLDLHSTPHTVVDGFCVEDGGPCTHRGEAECTLCGATGCTTLRLLALPYADHEAYQDAWRP